MFENVTVDKILNYINTNPFEYWFSWFISLLLVIFFLFGLFVVFVIVYLLILQPIFKYYCKKHGYVKIDKDNEKEVF